MPQTMPPFPWHQGGRSYHNLLTNLKKIKDFIDYTKNKICLDISHTAMSCYFFKESISTQKILGIFIIITGVLSLLMYSEKYLKWTLILGLGFTLSQTLIWSSLFDSGIYFTGPGSNASGSFFYVLTLLHLLHLAAGIIALIITYKNLIFGLYSSQNLLGVELCAIFWHFLDILWIFLFLFLLYIH